MLRVLTIVLAGGKGERLQPLTAERAKPAVPFGGAFRIIDFTLSNCIHSGLRQILVLTQYKSQSLDRHLRLAWSGFKRAWGEYLEIVPPQQRVDERWYEGTADAVYQNAYAIEQTNADDVLILSGDHIYAMDYRRLLAAHRASKAPATVACVPVPLAEGASFGVMGIDRDQLVVEFQEKPVAPFPLPDAPQHCLASMGVYVFRREFLLEQLLNDEVDADGRRDFGRNILPRIIQRRQVRAYPFRDPDSGEIGYWRDVGTVESYYQASRDLLSPRPPIDLRSRSWQIHSHVASTAPALIDFTAPDRYNVRQSMIGAGTVITDACVSGSILSSDITIRADAEIADSILFDGVTVGRGARLYRTIVDKHVTIAPGVSIGFDPEWDRERGFQVTESGVVVVPKGYKFSCGRCDGRAHAETAARDTARLSAATTTRLRRVP